MEEVVDEVMKLSVNGTEYEKLADGEYDVVVLGTGLTECVISGILSVAGLKVRGGRGCLGETRFLSGKVYPDLYVFF